MTTALRVDDIRVPEEVVFLKKIKLDPNLKKLLEKAPEILQPQVRWLNVLNKEAVRITKQTRPDVIDAIEQSFRLFGMDPPPYEVFGIKNFVHEEWGVSMEDENACILGDNGSLFVLFVHNILKTLTDSEIKWIVGHEIGHHLMGHIETKNELAALQWVIENAEGIHEAQQFHSLARSYYLWSQLQELSADRVGLMISQDLESAISGLTKIVGGFISEKISIRDFISQAESTPLEDEEDCFQTHPYPPHRGWALSLFYESDYFRRFSGQRGGKPLSEFSQSLPHIIPLNEKDISKDLPAPSGQEDTIEDLLLEVSLYGAIAVTDARLTPAENATILKFIPLKMQKEVVQKWNERMKELESKSGSIVDVMFGELLARAFVKDHRWKKKIIKNMIKVVKSDRRIRDEELIAVADYAARIDARKECRMQFLKEFGIDPYLE